MSDVDFERASTELARAVTVLAQRASARTGRTLTIAADAPNTFDTLCEHYRTQQDTLTVWSGGSDATIYPDHETNYAFRFWHDLDGHLLHSLDFTPVGETLVQTRHHIPTLRGLGVSESAIRLYVADTIGQVEYTTANHRFPDDQVAFCRAYLIDPVQAIATRF